MSLFQCGFRPAVDVREGENEDVDQPFVSANLPTLDESGLGGVEYNQVTRAVSELADPSTSKRKRGRGSGTYTHYTAEQHAKIGKYMLENGNERARCHFSSELPNLKESTIRSFRSVYKQKLEEQRKKPIHSQ